MQCIPVCVCIVFVKTVIGNLLGKLDVEPLEI